MLIKPESAETTKESNTDLIAQNCTMSAYQEHSLMASERHGKKLATFIAGKEWVPDIQKFLELSKKNSFNRKEKKKQSRNDVP